MRTTSRERAPTADDFSFTGNFVDDDDVQFFTFVVGGPSTVTLISYGYAGGTQADGNVVSDGGFDTILSLFDGSGNLIAANDDGTSSQVNADPTTGAYFDTYLQASLSAGTYTVAVTQYDNFFSGSTGQNISLGFDREGNPTFTGDSWGISGVRFVDVTGDHRSSAWAFDVLNVASATNPAVPEPGSIALLGLGLVGLGFATRRRRKTA